MKGKQITICGILVAIIGLLVLEGWTLANKHKEDTISEIIQTSAQKWPVITFLFGLLMGHWFWPLDVRKRRK